MTHIEQMIQDLCPNGVEYKKLGDLGAFENTGVDKKSHDDEQEVTLLNFMDVCRHKYIDASVPTMVVTAPDKKIVQCNVLKDDIFITPSSETIDEIGFAAVIMEDLPNVVYSYHIMRYRLNNPNTTTAKFIRYLFEAPVVRKQILKSAKGLTRFGLSKYQFADIEIPLPPIEIQKKIVECLDKFSALAAKLQAELQAELQARRKQYEFYRTQLLTPPQNISSGNSTDDRNWVTKPLGEICKFQNGFAFQSSKFSAFGKPILRITNIKDSQLDDSSLVYFNEEDYKVSLEPYKILPNRIVIAMSGATTGKVGMNRSKQVYYMNQRVGMFIPNESLIDNNYLFHFLSSQTETLYYLAGGGAQPNLSTKAINDLPIPLPSLAEQKHIAELLDKLSALTTSLTDGIPAEQAAQQKRYEYYRDKLLSFEKKGN